MFDDEWMQECRDLVGASSFIETCYVDYCLDPSESTLFNIYEAFFASCRESIGDEGAVCSWRGKLGFVECDNGKEWSTCGTECDLLSRCWGRVRTDKIRGIPFSLLGIDLRGYRFWYPGKISILVSSGYHLG